MFRFFQKRGVTDIDREKVGAREEVFCVCGFPFLRRDVRRTREGSGTY